MSDLGIVKHIKEMFYHKKWKFTLNFVIQYLKCGKTEETKKVFILPQSNFHTFSISSFTQLEKGINLT